MKRPFRLLSNNIRTAPVNLAEERQIRRLHEAPLGPWADALALGGHGVGTLRVAPDNVHAKLGAVLGEDGGQGRGDVTADAGGAARESHD